MLGQQLIGGSREGEGEGSEQFRFLLACWPFPGHIRPFLSLATALQGAGHQVAIYSGATARPLVEAEGHAFFPFAQLSEAKAYDSISAIDSVPQGGRPSSRLVLRIFRDWMVETIPAQLADLEPLVAEWRPDVIVTETAMWGPMLVLWEKTGIPVAIQSTLLGCLVPGRDAPPAGFGLAPPRTTRQRVTQRALVRLGSLFGAGLRRRIDAIRTENGLGPLGCTVNDYSGRLPLYLIGSLRELDYDRRDLPSSVHYVGPYLWHRAGNGETPEWLDSLPSDRPWVHVTESTLRYGDPFLLRTAVEALRDGPYEVILTTGQQRDPSELALGEPASNVHLAQWIPHAELLPRCAALVSSGGAGTVMAALSAGVPQIIVPTTWDKPDNARRLVEAGAGLSLAPGRCSADRFRSTVEEVIGDSRYRTRSQELARRLAASPGPVRAAELLHSLARSSRVIT